MRPSMEYAISMAVLIAGAAIAYYQARTAQQKVAIELFDERYKIYEDLKDVIVRFLQGINFTNELQQKYMDAQNRARFYFGAEVEDYLEKTRIDIIRGHYVDRFANRE